MAGRKVPKALKPKKNPEHYKPRDYFELNGDVHKKLGVNRGSDILYAWNYPKHARVQYNYTVALKRMKPVFRTGEVAWVMNRNRRVVHKAVYQGEIPAPQYSYNIEGKGEAGLGKRKYLWTEQDMLNLLAFFSTRHFGRPRKDGMIVPLPLPTPHEVRAFVNNEDMLFLKQQDAVPTWKAKEI